MRRILNPISKLPLALVLLVGSPWPVQGQNEFALRFDARSVSGFGFLGNIRPMTDGRIFIADPLGGVVAIVDLDDQSADTLGRFGGGPQEYMNPDGVFPLPGDSTLLVDMGNGRLTVIAPQGTFVRSIPITRQDGRGQLVISIPRFVDGRGGLFFEPEVISGGPLADSAHIVRLDLSSQTVDTLGVVKLADPSVQSGRSGISLGRVPLGARDDWAVASDGAVAILRANPYRVEWVQPGSPTIVGPETLYDPIRIDRREKEAWVEAFFTESISMGIRRGADGSRRVSLSRGTPGGGTLDVDQYRWPSHLPPFRAGRSLVSDEGDLWVERYVSVGSPVRIDIFGRQGRRIGEIQIPAGRRLAGFGAGVVYLIQTDALGLQWLERYRIVGR